MKNLILSLHAYYTISGFITVNKHDKLRYMGERNGMYAFLTDNSFEHIFTKEQLEVADIQQVDPNKPTEYILFYPSGTDIICVCYSLSEAEYISGLLNKDGQKHFLKLPSGEKIGYSE